MSDGSDGGDDGQPLGARADVAVTDPRFDTANRLQRSIDVQIRTIEGIDDKAEHVTRLLGVLLGVVLTVLSLGLRAESLQLSAADFPTWLAFGVGVGSLLLSMTAAIITYLNSRFLVGLDERAGNLLSDPAFETNRERHLHRLVGSYSYIIEINRAVIRANSRRFRRTLVLLLVGVVFLSTAAILFVGRFGTSTQWILLVIVTAATAGVSWYILTGNYLTVERLGGIDE